MIHKSLISMISAMVMCGASVALGHGITMLGLIALATLAPTYNYWRPKKLGCDYKGNYQPCFAKQIKALYYNALWGARKVLWAAHWDNNMIRLPQTRGSHLSYAKCNDWVLFCAKKIAKNYY